MEFPRLCFYYKGMEVDSLEQLIRILKTQGYSSDETLDYCGMSPSSTPIYTKAIESVESIYSSVEPYTRDEAIKAFSETQLDNFGLPF